MISIYSRTLVVLLCLASISYSSPDLSSGNGAYNITVDKADWLLQFRAGDFINQRSEFKPDGSSAYLLFNNDVSGLIVSFFIEPAAEFNNPKDYRDHSWEKQEPALKNITGVTKTDLPDYCKIEYTITEAFGVRLDQKNMNAHFVKNGFWIDVHLSKVQYVNSDQQLFDNFVGSISFISKNVDRPMQLQSAPIPEEIDTGAIGYLKKGNTYFSNNDLKKANIWYKKALNADKKNPSLPKTYWRRLVNNLGLCYGMMGDLKKAKEMFQYGISKDPVYPLFYYNMACAYAENGDLDICVTYLRKAYDNQQNVNEGEQMPDPATDPSFQSFLNVKKFKQVLEDIRNKTK